MPEKNATNRPPRWAENLVRMLLKPRDRDTVAGDLLEEYREVVLPGRGRVRASLWYLKQAFSLIDVVMLGVLLGTMFGIWNLAATWLDPLTDDTPMALLAFYGPMFALWAFSGFSVARRTGSLIEAIKAGAIVAFVTFTVFYIANLARVNLFLDVIRSRTDWHNIMLRFQDSGSDSFRVFVNLDYVRGAPLKIGVASVIGATTGLLGGFAARAGDLKHRRIPQG
jgi:hypothetical protein